MIPAIGWGREVGIEWKLGLKVTGDSPLAYHTCGSFSTTAGNYAWGSEQVTRKTRIIGVVYNASNNELVRTNTLVKNAIVQVDATPFRQWYEAHYGQTVTKKGKQTAPAEGAEGAEKKASNHLTRKMNVRKKGEYNQLGALCSSWKLSFNRRCSS